MYYSKQYSINNFPLTHIHTQENTVIRVAITFQGILVIQISQTADIYNQATTFI